MAPYELFPFVGKEGWETARKPCSSFFLPSSCMARAPSPASLQPESSLQFRDAEGDRREVKSGSTLPMLCQSPFQWRKKLGWPPAALGCTSAEEEDGFSLPLIHTHKAGWDGDGEHLALIASPPSSIIFYGRQHPPFLLRKWFTLPQQQLLSLENVWLFLHVSILWIKKK